MLAESSVKVKETVQQVRQQRPGMVQTEAQYKFLYDIIPYIVEAQNMVRVFICWLICNIFVSLCYFVVN